MLLTWLRLCLFLDLGKQTAEVAQQKMGREGDDVEYKDVDIGTHLLNNISGVISGAGNAFSKFLSKCNNLVWDPLV